MAKIAVVTGAASGIGRAVVQRFARDDTGSIVLDIDEAGGRSAVDEIRSKGKEAAFMRVDVTRAEFFQRHRREKSFQDPRSRAGRRIGREVFDRVVIERRIRVPAHDSGAQPFFQRRGGPAILVRGGPVAVPVVAEFQAHNILRMELVQ